ncbi:MAG: outer membrane beta-barrel protein [Verrucomicrobium sp.]|nr:outer membrane beta-barrel protein [Verrucomicrobium sp.]
MKAFLVRAAAFLALVAPFTAAAQDETNAPAAASSSMSQEEMQKLIQDQGIYLNTSKPGIVLSGYVDASYTYGFQGNSSAVPSRLPADGKPGSNFNLNALKLALEKPLSDQNEMSAGFRADVMVGQDGSSIDGTTSGATDGGYSGANNVFLEQAFVQLNAPVGNGIKFIIGKFATPLGYEVIERPSNANITYGNLYSLTPNFHTGVLASYKFNDNIDVKGGVVDGWNSSTGTSFGNATGTDGAGILGTINFTAPGGNANLQHGGYVGLNPSSNTSGTGNILGNPNDGSAYTASRRTAWLYDVWGQWKPKFAGNKLSLGFNGDLGSYATSVPGAGDNNTTWTGAALYAKYQFSKLWSLAGRADWIHSDDGQKFRNINAGNLTGSQDIYSYTLTAEFNAWENVLLRAEYRLDWGATATDLSPSASTPTVASTVSTGSGPAQLVDLEVVYSF